MEFTVIVTVGPSLLKDEILNQLYAKKNCIYRINGAHVDLEEARDLVHYLRSKVPHA